MIGNNTKGLSLKITFKKFHEHAPEFLTSTQVLMTSQCMVAGGSFCSYSVPRVRENNRGGISQKVSVGAERLRGNGYQRRWQDHP